MSGRRIYDRAIQVISLVYILIGAAILILTLARGGGALSLGVLLGIAFVAIGIGRAAIQRRIRGSR